ncbi:ornithine decarboxylase [Pseudomonas sp. p1(2021b)]|uniref:Orn/Lys/Arg family decarboxylase n=1 Tax=Pseudomonas sp. p1(2021b) TaxID=2874628 RepID=UPI001CCEF85D|nr:ornithine decarboxylase [Pseudomonas sp. p1(2021b)]UBM27326.1 ornithine decarboxylase [Pseudomonas sp. p1(2021b)]
MSITIVHSAALSSSEWGEAEMVDFAQCENLAHASALILTPRDAVSDQVAQAVRRWKVPLFVIGQAHEPLLAKQCSELGAIRLPKPLSSDEQARVKAAAEAYEHRTLPPFTRAVAAFSARRRPTYACPGHQGGQCLELHPAGVRLRRLLGDGIYRVDVPHAAPELGDVLCHHGPVREAEQLAARVFGADRTWFVLNGTSTANKVVTSALLTAGDLVLMDRNNHKSVFLGALVQCGALPVYLENVRDERGILGGYRPGALDESRLRHKAAQLDERRACQARPFRLAIVQHATCDGVIVDAAALLDRIGHLCDYVLFDAAWSGYEPFIQPLARFSPLAAPLHEGSPGIFVTQSVHKQMSGLSQASQIHKKDRHVQGQTRYCPGHVFNSAFMQHASTSPSYPLFMSLEVNAAMLVEGEGERHWQAVVGLADAFRLQVWRQCRCIKPLLWPSSCEGPQAHTLINDGRAVELEPGLHYLDPCKVILLTRVQPLNHVPACVVAHYLRDHDFTPEKADFYNFTLLITPSSTQAGLSRLVDCLQAFEADLCAHTPVLQALPSLRQAGARYEGMSLVELCQEINGLYRSYEVERRQADIFSAIDVCIAELSPQAANQRFIRGEARWAKVANVIGKVAAEGVIPYPPGILCIAPGERWTPALVGYLLAIEAMASRHPGFAPHIQGVHPVDNDDGTVSFGVFVLE